MENDLISIVVPVYNVEKYIDRCINSIINQTYKNLQIILVNDGSKDNSGKICDDYSKKDTRIQVMHKENGGLSDARNKGIEKAIGKYITFVDSDDFVETDYVEYLYNLIKKYNTDISFCKHKLVYNDNDIIKKSNEKEYKITKIEALKDILYAKNFEVSACAKLYLTKHFKDIKYPNGKLFEDNATTYKVIMKNEWVAVGTGCKYNYAIRNNSITKTKFSNEQLYLIKAVDDMCNDLIKYSELNKACYRKKYWARISTLNRMINATKRNKGEEKKLRKEIINYKKIICDKDASLRDKIAFILLLFGIPIYKLTWDMYEKKRRI